MKCPAIYIAWYVARDCACRRTFDDPLAYHSKSECVDKEWHNFTASRAQANHLILPAGPIKHIDPSRRDDLLAAMADIEARERESGAPWNRLWRWWKERI